MQDHVYVQYLELNSFQTRFREISAQLATHEADLHAFSTSVSHADEANALLDSLDQLSADLAVKSGKARDLIKLGQDLLSDHRFAADCVQPKCSELRRQLQKLEVILEEKRRSVHKFLDLIEGIEAANKWSSSALEHLDRQDQSATSSRPSSLTSAEEDIFSQIRLLLPIKINILTLPNMFFL